MNSIRAVHNISMHPVQYVYVITEMLTAVFKWHLQIPSQVEILLKIHFKWI